MTKKNEDIRKAAKKEGVPLWQIAEELGVSDNWFSRVLRKELTSEKKTEILGIITTLASTKETLGA